MNYSLIALELEKLKDKPWHISSSNALSGEGLQGNLMYFFSKSNMPLTFWDTAG